MSKVKKSKAISLKKYLIYRLSLVMGIVLIIINSALFVLNYKIANELQKDLFEQKTSSDLKYFEHVLNTELGRLDVREEGIFDENGISIKDSPEVVDSIFEDFGIVSTIFRKDGDDFISEQSSVISDDGSRYIGISLDKDTPDYEHAIEDKNYTGEAELFGKHYFTTHRLLKNKEGEVTGMFWVGIPTDQSKMILSNSLNKIFMISMLSLVITIIFIVIVSYDTGNRVGKIINKLVSELNKMAKLDLRDTEMEFGKLNISEIEDIKDSLLLLRKNLLSITKDLTKTSEFLKEYVVTLDSKINYVVEASTGIEGAIEDIAQGAMGQASDTLDTGEIIEEFKELLNYTNKNMNETLERVAHMENEKNEGLVSVNRLVESAEKSKDSNEEITNVVKLAAGKAEEVKDISVLIQSIADQTNLLALNASIEAARAGKEGRGFAVVAEEIGNLAAEVNESAKNIGYTIEELSTAASETLNIMDVDMTELVNEFGSISIEINSKFGEIEGAIDNTREGLEVVGESEKLLMDKMDRLVELVDRLGVIAQNNVANTEESSASIQEQTEGILEIGNASNKMVELSNSLDEQIQRFKI